jgi:hypothetical protein
MDTPDDIVGYIVGDESLLCLDQERALSLQGARVFPRASSYSAFLRAYRSGKVQGRAGKHRSLGAAEYRRRSGKSST